MGLEHLSTVVDALRDPNTGNNIKNTGSGIRDAVGGTAKDVGSVFSDILTKYREIKETATGKAKLQLEIETKIIEQITKLSPDAQLELVNRGFFDQVLEAGKTERDSDRAHELTKSAERKQFLKDSLISITAGSLIALVAKRAIAPVGEHTQKLMMTGMSTAALEPTALNEAVTQQLQDDPNAFLVASMGKARASALLTQSGADSTELLRATLQANRATQQNRAPDWLTQTQQRTSSTIEL